MLLELKVERFSNCGVDSGLNKVWKQAHSNMTVSTLEKLTLTFRHRASFI